MLDVRPRPRVARDPGCRAAAAHPAITPSSRPTRSNASSARSSCSSVWAAVTIVRIRALSSATVGKTTDVAEDALLEQPVREADRRLRVAQHHRRDRRLASGRCRSRAGASSALNRRVFAQSRSMQLGLLLHDPDRLAAGRGDGRRMARGEQERARPLDEDVAQGLRARPRSRRARRRPWTASRPGSRPGRRARSGRPSRGRPGRGRPTRARRRRMTAAPNASAASTIPGSGAMSPSMLKTPSVTTRISRYGAPCRRGPARRASREDARAGPSTSACG